VAGELGVKLVVGLGNPGKRYANTPHNAGFVVVDHLCRHFACRLKRSWRFRARLAQHRFNQDKLLLIQPLTFMNNSGEATIACMRYYRVEIENLIVLVDDADLPLGRLRVRPGGSGGGHRGLGSIIDHLGGDAFARVRIGVGRQGSGDLVNHVLGEWGAGDRKLMDESAARGAEAVICWLDEGVERAMNRFNGRSGDGET
jgi:PTH1 family peptidyl-tRNA hydrolase